MRRLNVLALVLWSAVAGWCFALAAVGSFPNLVRIEPSTNLPPSTAVLHSRQECFVESFQTCAAWAGTVIGMAETACVRRQGDRTFMSEIIERNIDLETDYEDVCDDRVAELYEALVHAELECSTCDWPDDEPWHENDEWECPPPSELAACGYDCKVFE